jgi:hypothetical protein
MSIENFGLPAPIETGDLDASLASIKPIVYTATATSSTPGIPAEHRLDEGSAPAEEPQAAVDEEAESDAEDLDSEADTEDAEVSPFATEFEATFGVKPDEAIEIVNGLKAFQDEMTLMRTWGVTPTEYDQRMGQVKEFYQSLPEDSRGQFNSVEGAAAIWNHLNKDKNTTSKKTKVKPGGSSSTSPSKTAEIIKKSDVLRMDDQTFKANAARINKAVLEGRFVEDV